MIRWILTAIGLIAIALLVWFGGPLVSIGESKPLESMASRGITILIVLLIWGINFLIRLLLEKRANDEMEKELTQAEMDAQAAEEAQAEKKAATEEELSGLKNNFQEALSILKKTKLKGRNGQQHLYDLPWYIIIGPPGSGKTTALANSGLRFPLADRFGPNALRGVGGTRDCDWWFTDEAVLIDTAGRYTTQDSDTELDSSGWGGFLEMLKKYRKRRPINGVFVALSTTDLMHSNESERAAHADAVKRRIQELREKLGVNPPVYMLFTKCDLISGFTEYFDDLGREEREQVWGLTLPLMENPSREQLSEQFTGEFSSLIERLNSRLMTRLNQERDMQRRCQIHAFPHQVMSLKENADRFLQDIFGPNRYQENFILRGVYFTSGTQEGSPIDRMMGSLASTFGLDRQSAPMFSGQGRSYFLTKLFQDLAFEESDIVGVNEKLEKQATVIRRVSYAAALLLTTGASLGWAFSFAGNSAYITGTEEKLALYEKEKQALTSMEMKATIPALKAIQDAANIYHIGEIDSYSKMGLSKDLTIQEPGLVAYQSALKDLLAPRIVHRLAEQLSTNSEDAEFMMDSLKAYLMMGQPERRDLEFLKSWVNSDIQSTLAGSTETQAILTAHVNQLFALEQPFPGQELSTSVVDSARAHLNSFPLAELVYTRLKEEAADEGLSIFNLSKAMGAGADEIFDTSAIADNKTIEGLFTRAGFKEYYLKNGLDLAKESTEQNWVLGPITSADAADPEALNREVGQLLENELVELWQELLNGIHITEFRNIRHGVQVLQKLSGTNSPLKMLLTDVSKHTTLIDPPSEEGKSKVKVKNKLVKKAMRLAKKAKKLQKKKGKEVMAEPGEYAHNTFLPLNTITTAAEGAQLNELLSLLAEVYIFLEEVAAVPNGKAAFDAATKIMKGEQDLLSRLKIKAARYPAPLKQWVKELSDNSWRVVLDNGNRYINTVWKEEVLPDYNAMIKNRYPVFDSTSREINMVEFSNFFGPEGTMELFYNNYMSPFITASGRNWSQKTMDGRGLGISRSGIATFQNANRIKKMFFGAGQLTPTVHFSMKPVDMDAAVARFSLSLDGQRIDYRHGPTRNNKLQWPGPDGSNQTRIRFETTDGSSIVDTEDGAWAFYRILDKASVSQGGQRNQLKVSFNKKEHNARYTLTTDSGVNPFRRAELAKFRVSERL